jgi:hypothetical protein
MSTGRGTTMQIREQRPLQWAGLSEEATMIHSCQTLLWELLTRAGTCCNNFKFIGVCKSRDQNWQTKARIDAISASCYLLETTNSVFGQCAGLDVFEHLLHCWGGNAWFFGKRVRIRASSSCSGHSFCTFLPHLVCCNLLNTM